MTDPKFRRALKAAKEVASLGGVDEAQASTIYVEYAPTNAGREAACRYFGLMTDEKAGVPRTSYFGVITFWRGSKFVYLAPSGTRNSL